MPEPITVGQGMQCSDWPGLGSMTDAGAGAVQSFRNTWGMLVQSEIGDQRRARMLGRRTLMVIHKSTQEKKGS